MFALDAIQVLRPEHRNDFRNLIRIRVPEITVPCTGHGSIAVIDDNVEFATNWVAVTERLPIVDRVVHATRYESRRVLTKNRVVVDGTEIDLVTLARLVVLVDPDPKQRKNIWRVGWTCGNAETPIDFVTSWMDMDNLLSWRVLTSLAFPAQQDSVCHQ